MTHNISNTRGAIAMHSERADNHTWRKIKSALASTDRLCFRAFL